MTRDSIEQVLHRVRRAWPSVVLGCRRRRDGSWVVETFSRRVQVVQDEDGAVRPPAANNTAVMPVSRADGARANASSLSLRGLRFMITADRDAALRLNLRLTWLACRPCRFTTKPPRAPGRSLSAGAAA